ncbi:MAG: hypothetical protein AAGJ52_10550, partial [Pseudomonadota bacterium]
MSDATTKAQPASRRWIKRLGLVLLVVLIVAILAAFGAYYWLTRTTSGASFALSQAQSALEEMRWSSLTGSLHNGLNLSDLEVRQASSSTRIREAEVAAQIQLLGGIELNIERLALRDIDVRMPPPDPTAEAAPITELPDLASPIPVTIESLRVDQLRVLAVESEDPLLIVQALDLAGRYNTALELDRFELTLPEAAMTASGQAGLSAPHRLDLQIATTTSLESIPEHQIDLRLTGPL